MSTSTSILVGYYIVAKMKPIFRTEMDVRCDRDGKHKIKGDEDFCPKCGSKVVEVPVEVAGFQSTLSLTWGDDVPREISDEDWAFLTGNFGLVNFESSSAPADEEILTIGVLTQYVDGDMSGITELPDPVERINRQPLPDLARLQRIMEYKSVELKYGVLVSIG